MESAGRAADKIMSEVDTFDAGYITFFPSSGNSIQNERGLGETMRGPNQMQGLKIEKRIPLDGPKRASGQRQDPKAGKKVSLLNKTNGSTEGEHRTHLWLSTNTSASKPPAQGPNVKAGVKLENRAKEGE